MPEPTGLVCHFDQSRCRPALRQVLADILCAVTGPHAHIHWKSLSRRDPGRIDPELITTLFPSGRDLWQISDGDLVGIVDNLCILLLYALQTGQLLRSDLMPDVAGLQAMCHVLGRHPALRLRPAA